MTPQEKYAEREQLIIDAVNLKESKRVSNATRVSTFPYYEYGLKIAESMRDFDKAAECYVRYHREFQPDVGGAFSIAYRSARAMEALGVKNYRWPGDPKGLDENNVFQFIEYETLLEDEYDELFNNTAEFAIKKLLPRTYEVFEPFQDLDFWDLITGNINFFTNPKMLDSYKRLLTAAEENAKFFAAGAKNMQEIKDMGFPFISGSGGATAFDMLGDTLRCTFGMMPDILTQPENVIKALEIFVKIHIKGNLAQYKMSGNRYQWVMLHKGFDYFIGDETYRDYYWKYLKEWMLALIAEDIVPVVFCEGAYNTRLKYLTEIPEGKAIFYFEEVDNKLVKEMLGGKNCIMGNFPLSLLATGTPEQVKDKTKETLDILAPGGGYLFSVSASVDTAPRANMEAMFETVEQYGKY